jgi:ribosomal protein S18 acetylase RimI-like enzyme
VREATASDRGMIADCLARAFQDDPVSEFLFPDATSRSRRLPPFYASVLRFFDHLGLVHTDEQLRGAAAWQAPSVKPKLRDVLPAMIGVGIALRSTWFRLSKLNAAVVPFHPREPHWYLAILGTDPSAQGTGVGSALIGPTLERCDTDGMLAYLESSKEANIGFYQRHGFRVVHEIEVPQGPKLWAMLREPR